ncbi:MAG: hypothetical protein J1F18_13250 [Lachnospiraceae bacterium]|nr:hypothetical protein [Lachnospiraceae bacterium]
MDTKDKMSFRSVLGYLLIGISVIMLGKSLMLCFSNDIWYDELFTVGMIEHSYGDLIAFTARDVHPPLYYCIVKFAIELCKLISTNTNTVIIAKIVSVLPYFILLLYSVTFIRRRFGIFTGGLFMFCVIAMPQLSAYTVEIRMYSWALLFVTAAFLHAYAVVAECESIRADNRTRLHAAALVIYGLAAAYTQYFACVAVIMVYLYVLSVFLLRDRGRVKHWLLWVILSIVGYVPWLYALYGQITAVSENYWILPLSWRSLGGCVKFLMKPAFANDVLNTVLAVVLFGVYIFVFMWNGVKLCHNRRVLPKQWPDFIFMSAGIGVLVGLVLFGFAASAILRPIFVYRYMIPALGCFWLAFALGVSKLSENDGKQPTAVFLSVKRKIITAEISADRIRKGITAAVCALVLLVGLRDYRAFMGEEEYKILHMQDTTAALDEIGAEDILIYNFDQVQMVLGYYADNDSYLWYGQPETLIQDICGAKGALDEDTGQIKEWIAQGRTVWFVGSFNSREDIVKAWRTEGLHVEETGSCLLERYWFNLYKLSVDV